MTESHPTKRSNELHLLLLFFLAILHIIATFLSLSSTFRDTGHEVFSPANDLCDECKKIVDDAPWVNVSYIDIAGNHDKHPHRGARDDNGMWGYKLNVTHLRSNPPALNMTDVNCNLTDEHSTALSRIHVYSKAHQQAKDRTDGGVRLLCAIYSTAQYRSKIEAIRETWAYRCDGFFVASTETDPTIDSVDIPHHGNESYNNMWQKVRSMWAYVYDNHYDEFDWFHIGGDDMWVVVENLRFYLESKEIRMATSGGSLMPDSHLSGIQKPLYLGSRMVCGSGDMYNTGGPGYTLNKAALKLLVVEGGKYYAQTKRAMEDVIVAQVFKKFNVTPYVTTDNSNSERYMHFTPGQHYLDKMPLWYRKYTNQFNYTRGPMHSSVYSCSFHQVTEANMRRFHVLLYGLCPGVSASDEVN